MKMNKIFAAGIAATLAVTSLASVASAEVAREFDMKDTIGKVVYGPVALGGGGYDLGKEFAYTETTPGTPDNYSINSDTTGDDTLGTADYYMLFNTKAANATVRTALINSIGSITIEINGKGMASNGATTVALTQRATLEAQKDAAGNRTGQWKLPIYAQGGPIDAFIPERFVQVDQIKITVTASTDKNATKTYTIYDEDLYNAIIKQKTDNGGATLVIDDNGELAPVLNGNIKAWWDNFDWSLPWGAGVADPTGYTAALVLTGTNNVYYGNAATAAAAGAAVNDVVVDDGTSKGITLCNKIYELLGNDNNNLFAYDLSEYKTDDLLAWMPKTTYLNDGIIYRDEVKVLSLTGDHASATIGWDADYNQTFEHDTTYNYNKGDGANGFAGLASQVADFFNGQKNGKITFHFTAKAKDTATSGWAQGGIPSTEVGLRNFLENAKPKDFALFVNYNTTTGSLQADAVLDPYASEVSFDISAILQSLGGLTIGTVQDLYYALDNGASTNNNVVGLWVDKVTLSYDENAKADTAAAADDKTAETVKEDPKADEAKTDDKADEIEIPDDTEEPDDDATVVIEEPDDAQTVVDNTADNTVVVNPGTTNTAPAADENPHTGVALAVVPAALAAAAMVISKKRK